MRLKNNPNSIKLIKLFFDPNEEPKNLNFSQICKFIRETFKVNQTEMAKKLGVTRNAYKGWETGEFEPNSKSAFNLSLIYLQAIKLKELGDQLNLNEIFFNDIVVNLEDLHKLRSYITSHKDKCTDHSSS